MKMPLPLANPGLLFCLGRASGHGRHDQRLTEIHEVHKPYKAVGHRPPAGFCPLCRSLHRRGQPLTSAQARHVPCYRGYEWRRAGNDLILISLASGVVFEVLHGVLG